MHRLGQARPTRVVRLIASDTVESRVLALQRFKAAAGNRRGGTRAAVGAGSSSSGAAAAGAGAGGGDAGGGEGATMVAAAAVEEFDSNTLLRFFNMSQPLVEDH